MFTDQEFSDLDDSFWESVSGPENLQNDLQLAAQLGKVLLERNKDLEEQVRQAQVAQYEQVREIELLTKQLEVLRNVNESRMRLYEDVDKNLQDIEKSNEQLRSDIKADKEKIKTFQRTINELELKCEDLQSQVDNRKDTEKKPHPKQQLSERRSCSVPSLPDAHEIARKLGYEYLGYGIDLPAKNKKELSKHEGELEELKETLRHMKKELSSETRRRGEVEKALEEVVTENQLLEDKMMRLEHDHGQLQMEIHNVQVRSIKHSKQSDDTSSVRSGVDDVDIEHDDVDLPGPRARLLRLKSGGSAYGSRESLQNLGLETDEVPHRMQDFEDVPVELNLKTPSTEKALPSFADADDDGVDYSVTLLSELENQYKSLVVKYEAMIESKSKRQTRDVATGEGSQAMNSKGTGTDHAPGAPKGGTRPRGLVLEPRSDVKITDSKHKGGAASANAAMAATRMAASLVSTPPLPPVGAAPTVIHRSSPFDLRSPLNASDQSQGGTNPPEYKMLFKEIFDTLRKSIVYDDELNKATGTSPAAEK